MRVALERQAYRLAYWVLVALSFVRPPHGRGAKCLLTSDGAVLLVRHTYGPREWELPGGGSRRNEPAAATMRRELREEVGVEVGDDAVELGVGRGPGRHEGTRVSYFTASVPDRGAIVRDPVEIAEVAWFDPEQLPTALGDHARRALRLYKEAIASPPRDPGSPSRG
jgi:8-oxo-dGTP pyrophosphatase MutT (NUDIX family)